MSKLILVWVVSLLIMCRMSDGPGIQMKACQDMCAEAGAESWTCTGETKEVFCTPVCKCRK